MYFQIYHNFILSLIFFYLFHGRRAGYPEAETWLDFVKMATQWRRGRLFYQVSMRVMR